MSEVNSKYFVREYSSEKDRMELENEPRDHHTIPKMLFEDSYSIICCYNTWKNKFFSNQCLIVKNVFQSNVKK